MVSSAHAASEAECAIWLCLPAGFSVSECGAAHSAFKKRLRKGKPPLPPLASCVTGPDASTGNGRYEMGFELWEACRTGYQPVNYLDPFQAERTRACVSEECPNMQPDVFGRFACEHYPAIQRAKPHFIKIWVDKEYQGQFFY